MNGLQVFKNNEFSIKSVVINEEPWFIGKDIAHILGYANANDALIKHVDQDDKKTIQKSQNAILENIPNRGLTIINESGLYSLILSSKLESAKRFKRWVTSEVLPQIRKSGAYLTDEKAYDITHNPNSLADLLLQAGEQLKKKDIVINEMKPKALFADAVTASETSILVRDFAKILKQNGVDIGEKRLYKWLRDNGFIIKNSTEPTQRAMEMGLFERIERTIQRSNKPPVVTSTTRITGKGQVYFTGKFLAEK
ncbi:phage antirepressor [Sharpea azabuensis]|uniref:phage antirepressor n=1 Tax=Sharpea azabuensis TaxID=322505 RepID=UPI00240A7E59|nr:phage antirepressor KilAC domain-containing protein [Sharpea azabuensis]MDD6512815.1 BRO family protein [Sharpea azabuensis]